MKIIVKYKTTRKKLDVPDNLSVQDLLAKARELHDASGWVKYSSSNLLKDLRILPNLFLGSMLISIVEKTGLVSLLSDFTWYF